MWWGPEIIGAIISISIAFVAYDLAPVEQSRAEQ